MPESKLPPGPWKARGYEWGDADDICEIISADGVTVIGSSKYGDFTYIEASPEVLRAIEALPMLVKAARAAVHTFGPPSPRGVRIPRWDDPDKVIAALRDALAKIDGRD
jgi:hypothetical protein